MGFDWSTSVFLSCYDDDDDMKHENNMSNVVDCGSEL